MTVTVTIPIQESAILRRRDVRDPLGIWAARGTGVGDAGGGVVLAQFVVPAARRASSVYTCYGVQVVELAIATVQATIITTRLLTNWPVTEVGGINGFSLTNGHVADNDGIFPASSQGELITSAMRYILLFDPRPGPNADVVLVEAWPNDNSLNETYVFEAWGYYWDRNVLDAPGGPRHPGSD